MKQLLFALLLLCTNTVVSAQKIYQTKSGKINFYSTVLLENIEAINNQVDSKLSNNGQLVFMVAIKGFRFENAIMQEHFNENYMDSDKYPKSVFQGRISNLTDVDFGKDGSYKTTVAGVLDMHGVKQPITALGTLDIKAGKASIKSSFKVKLADYNIKGALIGDKIAKELTITVDCKYD